MEDKIVKNRIEEYLDGLTLKEKFRYIAFDCEGRLCSKCQWLILREDNNTVCIKRELMREIEKFIQ